VCVGEASRVGAHVGMLLLVECLSPLVSLLFLFLDRFLSHFGVLTIMFVEGRRAVWTCRVCIGMDSLVGAGVGLPVVIECLASMFLQT